MWRGRTVVRCLNCFLTWRRFLAACLRGVCMVPVCLWSTLACTLVSVVLKGPWVVSKTSPALNNCHAFGNEWVTWCCVHCGLHSMWCFWSLSEAFLLMLLACFHVSKTKISLLSAVLKCGHREDTWERLNNINSYKQRRGPHSSSTTSTARGSVRWKQNDLLYKLLSTCSWSVSHFCSAPPLPDRRTFKLSRCSSHCAGSMWWHMCELTWTLSLSINGAQVSPTLLPDLNTAHTFGLARSARPWFVVWSEWRQIKSAVYQLMHFYTFSEILTH